MSKLILEIETVLEDLSESKLAQVLEYALGLAHFNEEVHKEKEEHLIETLGYNPADDLPDHEWEAMLRREQLARQIEELYEE